MTTHRRGRFEYGEKYSLEKGLPLIMHFFSVLYTSEYSFGPALYIMISSFYVTQSLYHNRVILKCEKKIMVPMMRFLRKYLPTISH